MARIVFQSKADEKGDGNAPLFLMVLPVREAAYERVRREGLIRAIERAGGAVQLIEGAFSYPYTRDFFAMVGRFAFYPAGESGMNEHQEQLATFITQQGYTTAGIEAPAHFACDGGNVIHDAKRQLIFTGIYSPFGDYDMIDTSTFVFGRKMGALTDSRMLSLMTTARHLDCCLGLLPDGRVLAKLDEIGETRDFQRAAGFTKDDHADQFLEGLLPNALERLRDILGPENVITFTFMDHPESAFVLDTASIRGDARKARSLSMLTNFEVAGKTIIAEEFPEALGNRIRSGGVRMISPADVEVDTFVKSDKVNAGGARCSVIKLPELGGDAPSYAQQLRGPRT